MSFRVMLSVTALLCLLPTRDASAQEAGKTGLVMGYPSIGIIWHATDSIAVRPEFSFSRATADATESSSWTLAVGTSALFYLTRTDNLRTYISPRYSYGRSSTTISIALPSVPIDNEVTARTWTVTGSFGVQYALSDRVGVFGEAGLGYAGSSTDSALVGRDRSKSVLGELAPERA